MRWVKHGLIAGLLFCGIQTLAVETFPVVKLSTTRGDIILRLRPDKAPATCANFTRYVQDGYYNNTLIHRVIDGFLIQGGGFTPDFTIKRTYPAIPNESTADSLKNTRGTVGMALTTNPNSATSQFYINVADNPVLDFNPQKKYGFVVFAEVIDGMKVVDQIKKVRTRNVMVFSELYKREVPLEDVPQKDIVIKSAKILRR